MPIYNAKLLTDLRHFFAIQYTCHTVGPWKNADQNFHLAYRVVSGASEVAIATQCESHGVSQINNHLS